MVFFNLKMSYFRQDRLFSNVLADVTTHIKFLVTFERNLTVLSQNHD